MLNGTYIIALKTPMGLKSGKLVLEEKIDALTGKLCVLGKENPIHTGDYIDDRFIFAGRMQTAVGYLSYECTGYVVGNTLSATVQTKKGDFAIKGKRCG